MSFRDLETGPKSGGHASKQQPKQRRDEDSTFERSIKANIQAMRDSIQKASEQCESGQRNLYSRGPVESDQFLEHSRGLSQQTEQLFRDWTVHLAGEPMEKHRKKFSFEKLQRNFEEEVAHLKEAARRAVVAQQELLSKRSSGSPGDALECRAMCEEQGSSMCGEDAEQGLLDNCSVDMAEESRRSAMQMESTLRNRIAEEREEGIKRIQNQVSEVNLIFRDLASIAHEQGQQFESIEEQAESAASNSKHTVQELRKAVDRQRSSRERLCCMLAIGLVLLCFVILPQVHALSFHHATGSAAVATVDEGSGIVPAGAAGGAAGRASGARSGVTDHDGGV